MAEKGADIHDAEPEPAGASESAAGDAGGEGQPARLPRWLGQVPYLIVLATMSAGIVVVAAAYFKRGPALIAGALLLAAAFRAVLGPQWAGMLAVRSRWFDVATCIGLAALLIILAWVAPQL